MNMDLTGITNKNEYYTNHYFSTLFEEDAKEKKNMLEKAMGDSGKNRMPWSMLRQNAKQYCTILDRCTYMSTNMQTLANVKSLADDYMASLGYPEANPSTIRIDDSLSVPVYLEMTKSSDAPLLWIVLCASMDPDDGIMESHVFDGSGISDESVGAIYEGTLSDMSNEELATKIFFSEVEPPRFILFVGLNQVALVDRSKWNEKRHLQFELDEIFSRREESTLQAMAVLLHKDSLCPADGKIYLDELDEQSRKNASGVSEDLKFALRESVELLGNEVLYDMMARLGRNLDDDPVDAGELTLECLRYMYRMLFVLFIESRPELGYAPVKSQSYYSAYSMESLRDIADGIRDDIAEVGDGYYLHETLSKLYNLIYEGYPKAEEELMEVTCTQSYHDLFLIEPLKAPIFDPENTKMINGARLRNSCMLKIIDLMSLTRQSDRRNMRRGRISYANLGINQMGSVYEALLSYRGFIAGQDLYEVKREGDDFNELDVGYFVPESELGQYNEKERVRYESGEMKGQLRVYRKGTFIYRLAGREREKSASYYTPECLTKCLVKYALKELLADKTADDILQLTVCEPAMGSAAFLNEAINQLAEAYISRKEKETGEVIGYENRFDELQKVKMYIADHNVYGIDLNPVAVELAEVSLWLNTIYEGAYVPWFGNQLVNGNSLIGARRQAYRVENLRATSAGMRWYETEPERIPLGKERYDKGYRGGRSQVYHFLLGDPGMCDYSDKAIKSLEPENIKKMTEWNRKFTQPITEDEAVTLLRLSKIIDDLWGEQVALRKEVREKTWDNMSVFGHTDETEDSHTTIREKDAIYHELYKSEHMQNAGPYARLKFAMDYWCALWFWPIDKADLLPSRSEFLFDMSLILEGTTESVLVTDVTTEKKQVRGQLSLFPTDMQKLEEEFNKQYEGLGDVDIPALREKSFRLDLAAKIAEQNHFMHWELEFAEVFADRGGFDLILGNPPWIKLEWHEQGILSDRNAMFAVKNMSAVGIARQRESSLKDVEIKEAYLEEYESISGQQNFLNAYQNYPDLKGQMTNLFKCFLPQAWAFADEGGVSAFLHPDGVYDDPKGGELRENLYPRLRRHFMFTNERKLFAEVDHHTQFSINVYGRPHPVSFDAIYNLFDPETIEQCYDGDPLLPVPGIKDEEREWNIKGHPDRVIHVTQSELTVFAKLFDGNDNWKQAKLPVIHATQFMGVLECFISQPSMLLNRENEIYCSTMWQESGNQIDGTISRNIRFPESIRETIYSGPHIGVANPLFKTSRSVCILNSDFDNIDLTSIGKDYLQRVNYSIACGMDEYEKREPSTSWGKKYSDDYRLCFRRMLNQSGERTLIGAIIPPFSEHIDGILGFNIREGMVSFAANAFSLPFDFLLKVTGKSNLNFDGISSFPILESWKHQSSTICRALILNCLTGHYSSLWEREFKSSFKKEEWSKKDSRLSNARFSTLQSDWTWDTPLRSDYERRQALVEIDVLTAMALGMTLDQLKTIYRIQFPVLQQYEADTWYDANGRIVYTTNRSLNNVGFEKAKWEKLLKGAEPGKRFTRTIVDDTMPGGSVERTIEYVAPFDRCDREEDYETAWKFFEERFKEETD